MARPKAFDREMVLQKAMHVFWQFGFEATSMQQLVDAMGINRQSLYDTFGDKHQLYLEALELYRCGEGTVFLEPLNEAKPLSKRLALVFDRLIEESVNDEQRKGCLMINATLECDNQDVKVRSIIEDNFLASTQRFERLICEARTRGEALGDQSPRALAVFIVHSISGLRVLAKSTTDQAALQMVAKMTLMALE